MAIIHTTKCTQAAGLLDEMNIAYEQIEVPLGQIDKNDYSFQCRSSVPTSADQTVREYAQRMVSGDVFPTIVVWRKSSEKYVTVCGRHRLAAMLYAFKPTDTVSVLHVDDSTDITALTLFSVRENTKNGLRQSNAELVERAARELMKLPLSPPAYEHPRKVIREVSVKAGVDSSHVKRHYYAKLASREFRNAALNPPDNIKALYALWKYRNLPDWRDICRIVHDGRNAPKIHEIIEGLHRDKVSADSIASELKARLENAMSVVGLQVFKRQAVDPVSELAECLSLAERSFSDLPMRKDMPDERSEEIDEHMMLLRRAYRQWRDMK